MQERLRIRCNGCSANLPVVMECCAREYQNAEALHLNLMQSSLLKLNENSDI